MKSLVIAIVMATVLSPVAVQALASQQHYSWDSPQMMNDNVNHIRNGKLYNMMNDHMKPNGMQIMGGSPHRQHQHQWHMETNQNITNWQCQAMVWY